MHIKNIIVPTSGDLKPKCGTAQKLRRNSEAIDRFTDVFIEMPVHSEVLGHLSILQALGNARSNKPQRGVRFISPSGSGKSASARAYVRSQNAGHRNKNRIPVLYVPIGDRSSTKEVLSNTLRLCGDRFFALGNKFSMRNRIERIFSDLGVELVIFDEVHHLLEQNSVQQVVSLFKALLEEGVCPLALIGTEKALPIFCTDPELSQRIKDSIEIKPLSDTEADFIQFANFLVQMDEALIEHGTFECSSDFRYDFALECLFEVSGGHIGRVARTLQAALEHALYRNANRIEFYDLAAGVDKWAIPGKFVQTNPFRRGIVCDD